MDDLGGFLNDLDNIIIKISKGNIWNLVNDAGCLKSSFRVKFLKDRFPNHIKRIIELSGVNRSMTQTNVNELVKRLYHMKTAYDRANGGGCKKPYEKTARELCNSYIKDLENLLRSNGFVQNGFQSVDNYNQTEGFDPEWYLNHKESFSYPIFEYQGSGDYYGTIGNGSGGSTSGGSPFPNDGGGYVQPVVKKANVNQWIFMGLAGWALWNFALKDSKEIKKILK